MRRIVTILHLPLLLPLSGVAEEVDTVEVRRFMGNPLGLLKGRAALVDLEMEIEIEGEGVDPEAHGPSADMPQIVGERAEVFMNERDYVGNLVYQGGVLDKILIDGGYINASDGSYHFFVTDRLGNVRVVVNAGGGVEQVNHYDPYGGTLSISSVPDTSGNSYKWGGKEWDKSLYCYDFGARLYDPSDLRWGTMDPLCEKYYSLSPYAYCANNPMNLVDPSGMDSYLLFNDGSIILGLRNDDNYDTLYYQNADSPDYITVYDQGILSDLSSHWSEGFSYSVSSSYEMLNVFDFVSSRTSVEWAIGSYRDKNNRSKFALVRGNNNGSSVNHISSINDINEEDVIANIHTHIGYLEEHGASGGYSTNGEGFPVINDRYNIINMYYRLSNKGITLPKHFVYEVPNGVIYQYTPWKGDIYYGKYSIKTLRHALNK